ncbi:MAG: hypothetical protein BZ138_02235 [Methanosphaera sp. rholeuAM270]|nr:MAG: hypothetical protein BZ138_02235 [Methanosphaera sp. rholeuAM270]
MRIPENIRNTKHFDKARLLKRKVEDTKNIYLDKVDNGLKELFREKRYLSEDQKNEIISLIRQDNKNNEIPRFNNIPLVSIIIVNHNGASHLTRLLNVIDDTIHLDYELIIVDNASNDNSLDIIDFHHELPITLIKNQKNESFSYANNQGVKIAKGDYLLFLNNDTEPLDGWLNHMVDTLSSRDDVGAVGSKLIYPDCDSSKINREKSYTIQHSGIIFKGADGYTKPFNRDNSSEYADIRMRDTEEEIIAVTAACLLIRKSVYLEVGGFDTEYLYGYEDVDLCLKLYKAGYKNIYNPKSVLYHYEFGTQEKNNKKEVRNRRLNNQRIFIKRWNKWLRKELLDDLFNNKGFFTDRPLTVSFVVTQSDENTTAGDYFTALTLAKQLEKFGWNIKYQSRFKSDKQRDWYQVDEDVDVLISLLDAYDLSKVKCKNGLLVKIAWLRNWFERWVENPSFSKYDIVLASSQYACDYVRQTTRKEAILFPLASDTEMFNEDMESDADYECDYCFTGSYWDAKREIIDYLDPESVDYKFHLYGANWIKVPNLADYSWGFVKYEDIPKVYASTKLVIDDANHVTKEWGSVNSRVFDSLSSGKLIITNGSKGNQEIFGGKIPEYHSREELTDVLNYYLSNPHERDKKIEELRGIVLDKHTYRHRADTLKQILKEYYEKPKIAIKTPVPKWEEIHKWGDYYVAEGLSEEFKRKGYIVKIQMLSEWDDFSDSDVDIVIVLRGLSRYTPKVQHYNIMWNISHSDLVPLNEYESYDYVFIASKHWTQELAPRINVPVECMWQCTNSTKFYPEYNEKYKSELLFVGNSRKVYRKILKDLLPTKHNLSVYGADWEGIIDKKYIKGKHIPNKELHQAYSSCIILLNDHWEDMREKGFISNRIFDGIACGARILSDPVEGLDELFPGVVYTYHDKNELNDLIEEIIENPREVTCNIEGHTYEDRVNQFIEIFE